jgi:hypothetical protein
MRVTRIFQRRQRMDSNRGELQPEARDVACAPTTLAKMRVRGDGPPFSKAGVVYDIGDLDDWLQATRPNSTRPTKPIAQV